VVPQEILHTYPQRQPTTFNISPGFLAPMSQASPRVPPRLSYRGLGVIVWGIVHAFIPDPMACSFDWLGISAIGALLRR